MVLRTLQERLSICNNNSLKSTIITLIALVPVIPGGFIMLLKYVRNIKLSYNRYYSFSRFQKMIYDNHRIEIFRR